MTFFPVPSDVSIRRGGYTSVPATVTPAQPKVSPPTVTPQPTPAPFAAPSTFENTPGTSQKTSFNPISPNLFKKIQQNTADLQTPTKMDPELAEIVKNFKAALAQISPPPDSQLARIVNQFKAVVDKLAEKMTTPPAAPAPESSDSAAPPTAPTEPSSVGEALSPAEPVAAPEPNTDAEPTSEPAVAEEAAATEGSEASTEAATSENPAESGEVAGGEAPATGAAPAPESPKESENPVLQSPQDMLKGSINELLEMFQKKRLENQLNAFEEEQLQRMRDTLNQTAQFLRGMA